MGGIWETWGFTKGLEQRTDVLGLTTLKNQLGCYDQNRSVSQI